MIFLFLFFVLIKVSFLKCILRPRGAPFLFSCTLTRGTFFVWLQFCPRRVCHGSLWDAAYELEGVRGRHVSESTSLRMVQIAIKRRCQREAERDHSFWQQVSHCQLRQADEEDEI